MIVIAIADPVTNVPWMYKNKPLSKCEWVDVLKNHSYINITLGELGKMSSTL